MITIRFIEEKPYSGNHYTSRELDESETGCPDDLKPSEKLDYDKIPIAHCTHCGERLIDFCQPLSANTLTEIETIFKQVYDIEVPLKYKGKYYRDFPIYNFLEYAQEITKNGLPFRCPSCNKQHETIYVTKLVNIIFIGFI